MPNEIRPSHAEVREARATLRQHKLDQMRAEREVIKPAVDLTASSEFAAIADQLNGIDRSLFAHRQIGPHLYAIQAGVDALLSFCRRLEQAHAEAEAAIDAEAAEDGAEPSETNEDPEPAAETGTDLATEA